jgi:hypothetical protein
VTINTYYFVDPFAQKQEPKRTKKEVYRLGNLWFEEVGGLLKPLIGAELEEVKKKFQYKKTLRSKPPKAIDPHKNYSPAEVATLLNISYDTAIRRMEDEGDR